MENILAHWEFIVAFMVTVTAILFADGAGKSKTNRKG